MYFFNGQLLLDTSCGKKGSSMLKVNTPNPSFPQHQGKIGGSPIVGFGQRTVYLMCIISLRTSKILANEKVWILPTILHLAEYDLLMVKRHK